MLDHIRRVHGPEDRPRLYGARKVWHELAREQARGEHPELGPVPRCQVERLMRTVACGVRRDKGFVTTRPDPAASGHRIWCSEELHSARPNELWVVDFTYVRPGRDRVLGVRHRRVLTPHRRLAHQGDDADRAAPRRARDGAVDPRQQADELVHGLIHHSDAGGQYTAIRYSHRLADVGAVASIGSVGDSYDNAMAERDRSLQDRVCPSRRTLARRRRPRARHLELGGWFNETRLHGEIGHVPPVEFEADYYRQINAQQQPLLGEPSLH